MESEVRVELEAILSSRGFANSPRLCRFFRFVVERTLAGDYESLKESIIGADVFDRASDYDPKAEPIVRTEARRLRAKIDQYYEERGPDAIVLVRILVPKGGYIAKFDTPQMPVRVAPLIIETIPDKSPLTSTVAAVLPAPCPTWRKTIAGLLLFAAGIGMFLAVKWFREDSGALAPPATVPLTTFVGDEYGPSFSPDGRQVAFMWAGEDDANIDIYAMEVDGARALRRLTTNPGRDEYPAWSPDGRWIAFRRDDNVLLISSFGGAERVVGTAVGTSVAWSPDSTEVLVPQRIGGGNVLVALSIATGKTRPLLGIDEKLNTLQPFGISTDGTMLVFTRLVLGGSRKSELPANLFVRRVDGGPSTSLTRSDATMRGWTWIPGTREVVFCSNQAGDFQLWRVDAQYPDRAPRVVEGAAAPCGFPSAAREQGNAGSRTSITLAYERRDFVLNLRTFTIPPPGAALPVPERILASTRRDSHTRFSPDGSKLAFVSNRSGAVEIWMAGSPGNNPSQLTAFGSGHRQLESPVWSPDGSEVLFIAEQSGTRSFYVLPAAGGALRQAMAANPGDANPEWSRDGRYLYFTSMRSGKWQIWKAAYDKAAGKLELPGAPITVNGGVDAHESADGRTLYFIKDWSVRDIWSVQAAGGSPDPEKLVMKGGAYQGWWYPAGGKIYFLKAPDGGPVIPSGSQKVIASFDLKTKHIATVAEFTGRPYEIVPNFTVSPDGRRIVFGRVDYSNIDIVLLRNFH